jgi:subtilisin family serine protease
VRVAVIDSGMHASHPHIGGIAGGATIGDEADESSFTDLVGHGTAVMAAMKEKAPDADYFAVRVFYTSLRTSIEYLLKAIDWCIDSRMDVVNISLGTRNPAHRERSRQPSSALPRVARYWFPPVSRTALPRFREAWGCNRCRPRLPPGKLLLL